VNFVTRGRRCPLKVRPLAESSKRSSPRGFEYPASSRNDLGFRGHWDSDHAATTLIRPPFRERGLRRITISTSWSSAVSRFIKRSTEKPASL
jgi:hypothetical protein